MMKFELGLSEPDRNRPWRSALTVGGSYVLGALRRAFHRDTMNELILWNFYRTFRSYPSKRGAIGFDTGREAFGACRAAVCS
jgi:hypothetical protein